MVHLYQVRSLSRGNKGFEARATERRLAAALCMALSAFLVAIAMSLQGCQTPTSTPTVSGTPETQPSASQSEHGAIPDVTGSACAKYNWKSRGVAPAGYIQGMANVFAKAVCDKDPDMLKLGDAAHDGLAWYGKSATLVNTYTLLIGSGMMESSGKWCEALDPSASNHDAETAEAGPFQTSFNSRSVSPKKLAALWDWYKAHPERCDLATWKKGVSASDIKGECSTPPAGSGAGRDWQAFSRECPAFATEWAAVITRNQKSHYGPIKNKLVQFNNDCAEMFLSIEKATTCK